MRVQDVVLRDESDAAEDGSGRSAAVGENGSAGRNVAAGEDGEEGGLAASGRAENGEEFAGGGGAGDPLEDRSVVRGGEFYAVADVEEVEREGTGGGWIGGRGLN